MSRSTLPGAQSSDAKQKQGQLLQEFLKQLRTGAGHSIKQLLGLEEPDVGRLQGAVGAPGEGCRQRRGRMSPRLTSKLPKEKCVNTHILALTPSYRLPPCSCCVWLGRRSGVLREGFMKEEACYGEGSQAEGMV